MESYIEQWRSLHPRETESLSDMQIALALMENDPTLFLRVPELARYKKLSEDQDAVFNGAAFGPNVAAEITGQAQRGREAQGQLRTNPNAFEEAGVDRSLFQTYLSDPASRGHLMAKQANIVMNFTGPDDSLSMGEVQELVKIRREMAAMKSSTHFQEFQEAASFGEAWGEFWGWKETPAIIFEVTVESLSALLSEGWSKIAGGAAVGGAAGTAGGPLAPLTVPTGAMWGAAAGLGKTSYNLSASSKYMEVIADTVGGDVMDDPQLLFNAINDPKVIAKARSKAQAYGIPIGLFDTMSMGLAGRAGKVGRKIAASAGARVIPLLGKTGLANNAMKLGLFGSQKAAPAAIPIGFQMTMGAGGEAMGQLMSEGKVENWKDVFLEGVAELGFAPFEMSGAHLTRELKPEHAKYLGDKIRDSRKKGVSSDELKAEVDAVDSYDDAQKDAFKEYIDKVFISAHDGKVPDDEKGAEGNYDKADILAALNDLIAAGKANMETKDPSEYYADRKSQEESKAEAQAFYVADSKSAVDTFKREDDKTREKMVKDGKITIRTLSNQEVKELSEGTTDEGQKTVVPVDESAIDTPTTRRTDEVTDEEIKIGAERKAGIAGDREARDSFKAVGLEGNPDEKLTKLNDVDRLNLGWGLEQMDDFVDRMAESSTRGNTYEQAFEEVTTRTEEGPAQVSLPEGDKQKSALLHFVRWIDRKGKPAGPTDSRQLGLAGVDERMENFGVRLGKINPDLTGKSIIGIEDPIGKWESMKMKIRALLEKGKTPKQIAEWFNNNGNAFLSSVSQAIDAEHFFTALEEEAALLEGAEGGVDVPFAKPREEQPQEDFWKGKVFGKFGLPQTPAEPSPEKQVIDDMVGGKTSPDEAGKAILEKEKAKRVGAQIEAEKKKKFGPAKKAAGKDVTSDLPLFSGEAEQVGVGVEFDPERVLARKRSERSGVVAEFERRQGRRVKVEPDPYSGVSPVVDLQESKDTAQRSHTQAEKSVVAAETTLDRVSKDKKATPAQKKAAKKSLNSAKSNLESSAKHLVTAEAKAKAAMMLSPDERAMFEDRISTLAKEIRALEVSLGYGKEPSESHPIFDNSLTSEANFPVREWGRFALPGAIKTYGTEGEAMTISVIESWRRRAAREAGRWMNAYGTDAADWAWQAFAKTLTEAKKRVDDAKAHGRDILAPENSGIYENFGGVRILMNDFTDNLRKAKAEVERMEKARMPGRAKGAKSGAAAWEFLTKSEIGLEAETEAVEQAVSTEEEKASAAQEQIVPEVDEIIKLADWAIAGMERRTPASIKATESAIEEIKGFIDTFVREMFGTPTKDLPSAPQWSATELKRRIIKEIIFPELALSMDLEVAKNKQLPGKQKRLTGLRKQMEKIEALKTKLSGKRATKIIKVLDTYWTQIEAGRLFTEEALEAERQADIAAGVEPLSKKTIVKHSSPVGAYIKLMRDEGVFMPEDNFEIEVKGAGGAESYTVKIDDFMRELDARKNILSKEAVYLRAQINKLVMTQPDSRNFRTTKESTDPKLEGVIPKIKRLYAEFNRNRRNLDEPLVQLDPKKDKWTPYRISDKKNKLNEVAKLRRRIDQSIKSAILITGMTPETVVQAGTEAGIFAEPRKFGEEMDMFEAQKPFMALGKGDVTIMEAFDHIFSELSPSRRKEALRFLPLIRLAARFGDKVGTKVFFAGLTADPRKSAEMAPAFYDHVNDQIIIDPSRLIDSAHAFDVLMEEYLHALTVGALKSKPVLYRQLMGLLEKAREARRNIGEGFGNLSPYFLTNEWEFIAHAMFDPEVQSFLSSIEGTGQKPMITTVQGLLANIWELIRKMIGLKAKDGTLLSEVLENASAAIALRGKYGKFYFSPRSQPTTSAKYGQITIRQMPNALEYTENIMDIGVNGFAVLDRDTMVDLEGPVTKEHFDALKNMLDEGVFPTVQGEFAFAAAFHGTPREEEIKKFSTDFIGTGEGRRGGTGLAGWGLYFTTNRQVAAWYRDMDKRRDIERGVPTYKGESVDYYTSGPLEGGFHGGIDDVIVQDVLEYLRSFGQEQLAMPAGGFSDNKIRSFVKRFDKPSKSDLEYYGYYDENSFEELRGYLEDALDAITDPSQDLAPHPDWEYEPLWYRIAGFLSDKIVLPPTPEGKRYEVTLAPAEDEYLLWDENYHKQSEKVQAALEEVEDTLGTLLPSNVRDGKGIYEHLIRSLGDLMAADERRKPGMPGMQWSHKPEIAGWWQEVLGEEPGRGRDKKAASLFLLAHGIKGNKFRGDRGTGSYNYVIFDDADVQIEGMFAQPREGAEAKADLSDRERLFLDEIQRAYDVYEGSKSLASPLSEPAVNASWMADRFHRDLVGDARADVIHGRERNTFSRGEAQKVLNSLKKKGYLETSIGSSVRGREAKLYNPVTPPQEQLAMFAQPRTPESDAREIREAMESPDKPEGIIRSEMSFWEKFKEGLITKSAMLDTMQELVFKTNRIAGKTRLTLAELDELQAGSPVKADLRAAKLDSDIYNILGSNEKTLEVWGAFLLNRRIQDRLESESTSVASKRIDELMKYMDERGNWNGTDDQRFELINLTVRSKEVGSFKEVSDIPRLGKAADVYMNEVDNPDLLRHALDDAGNVLEDSYGNAIYEGKFVEASEVYHKHLTDSLYDMYVSGVISAQAYNRITRSTSFYVPFYVLKYFNRDPTDSFGKYITGIDKDFKIIPPMDAARFKLYTTQLRIDRNIYMQKLEDFRRDFDPDGNFILKMDTLKDVPLDMEEVRFYEDGKVKYLVFDREVAKLLKHFDPVSTTHTYTTMKLAGDVFKLGATGINIFFQAGNFLLMDPIRLLTTSKAGLRAKDKGLSPIILALQYIKAMSAASWANLAPNSIKNLVRKFAPDTTAGLDALYDRFVNSGAAGSTIAEYFDKPTGIKDPLERGNTTSRRNPLIWFNSKASQIGKTLEQTAKIVGLQRMEIFEGIDDMLVKMEAEGNPKKRAGMKKELEEKMDAIAVEIRNYAGSPDFIRKGKWTENEALNVVFMFFNARVQGVERDMSRLSKVFSKDKESQKTAMATMFKLSAFAALPTFLAWSMNRRDEEAEEDYAEVSEEERRRYFMIPLPERFEHPYIEGKMVRDYIRIPRRESFGLFSYTLEKSLDWMSKEDPDAVNEMLGFWLESTMPINVHGITEGDPIKTLESVASSMNPIIKGTAEQVANRNFFRHKPIIPLGMQKAESKEQYFESTPDVYRSIGSGLGLSPLRIKHFVETLTASGITQFIPPKDVGAWKEGRTGFGRGIASTPLLSRFARSTFITETELSEIINDESMEDATARVIRRRMADRFFKDTEGMSVQDRVRNIPPPRNSDEKLLYDLIVRRLREKALKLEPDEIQLKRSSANVRSSVIIRQIQDKTPAETKVYLTDLARKGILTKAVGLSLYYKLEARGETIHDYMKESVR